MVSLRRKKSTATSNNSQSTASASQKPAKEGNEATCLLEQPQQPQRSSSLPIVLDFSPTQLLLKCRFSHRASVAARRGDEIAFAQLKAQQLQQQQDIQQQQGQIGKDNSAMTAATTMTAATPITSTIKPHCNAAVSSTATALPVLHHEPSPHIIHEQSQLPLPFHTRSSNTIRSLPLLMPPPPPDRVKLQRHHHDHHSSYHNETRPLWIPSNSSQSGSKQQPRLFHSNGIPKSISIPTAIVGRNDGDTTSDVSLDLALLEFIASRLPIATVSPPPPPPPCTTTTNINTNVLTAAVVDPVFRLNVAPTEQQGPEEVCSKDKDDECNDNDDDDDEDAFLVRWPSDEEENYSSGGGGVRRFGGITLPTSGRELVKSAANFFFSPQHFDCGGGGGGGGGFTCCTTTMRMPTAADFAYKPRDEPRDDVEDSARNKDDDFDIARCSAEDDDVVQGHCKGCGSSVESSSRSLSIGSSWTSYEELAQPLLHDYLYYRSLRSRGKNSNDMIVNGLEPTQAATTTAVVAVSLLL